MWIYQRVPRRTVLNMSEVPVLALPGWKRCRGSTGLPLAAESPLGARDLLQIWNLAGKCLAVSTFMSGSTVILWKWFWTKQTFMYLWNELGPVHSFLRCHLPLLSISKNVVTCGDWELQLRQRLWKRISGEGGWGWDGSASKISNHFMTLPDTMWAWHAVVPPEVQEWLLVWIIYPLLDHLTVCHGPGHVI